MSLLSPTDLTAACILMTPKSLPSADLSYNLQGHLSIQLPLYGDIQTSGDFSTSCPTGPHNIAKTKITFPQTVSSFCLTWKYYTIISLKDKSQIIISIVFSPNSINSDPTYFSVHFLPRSYCHGLSSTIVPHQIYSNCFFNCFLTLKTNPTSAAMRITFTKCKPTLPLQCLSSIFEIKSHFHCVGHKAPHQFTFRLHLTKPHCCPFPLSTAWFHMPLTRYMPFLLGLSSHTQGKLFFNLQDTGIGKPFLGSLS